MTTKLDIVLRNAIYLTIVAIFAVVVIPAVSAYSYPSITQSHQPTPSHIAYQLNEILADGDYRDLRDLRDETDVEWMPWIDSSSDFREEQRLYEDIQEAIDRRQEEYEDHLKELDKYRRERDYAYSEMRRTRSHTTIIQSRTYPAALSTRFIDEQTEIPRVRSAATWNGRPLAGHYSLRHLYREASLR